MTQDLYKRAYVICFFPGNNNHHNNNNIEVNTPVTENIVLNLAPISSHDTRKTHKDFFLFLQSYFFCIC
jgi:hypothetical protein